MAIITAQEEVARLRRSGQILAGALGETVRAVRPGITTRQLDRIAEAAIRRAGGQPAFKNYQGYPATLCASVNSQVVHGIPDSRRLREGEIIGLDLGVEYQGLYTDQAVTVPVGKIAPPAERLIADTRQALELGLAAVRPGGTTGDIGAAIQGWLEPRGYGIVRQLSGHGLGHAVHEPPAVPNVGRPASGPELTPGLVIAIEPMVTIGDWRVKTQADGWTVVTVDDSLAAHFEHTVRVTDSGYELITADGGRTVLGVDVGEKKIGLAIGNRSTGLAFVRPPLLVTSWSQAWPKLEQLIASENIESVVVGWPLNAQGQPGPQAERIRQFIADLKQRIRVPVVTRDERLTTQAVRREQRGRRLRRGQEDSLAAQLLVESYLEESRR